MKSIFFFISIYLCLGSLPSFAATSSRLKCEELNLSATHTRIIELSSSLYPESRDRIAAWVEKSKKDSNPETSCETLSLARDALARLLGPRVIEDQKPDPMNYPERFSKCVDPKKTQKKLSVFMILAGKDLYPKERKQVRAILGEAKKQTSSDPVRACSLYDEVRNYLLDLWPYQLKKLQ